MKIHYLRDSSGGIEKFLKYQETIEKFINRGSKAPGLNFEKLRVSEKAAIYSIRIDDASRILLMKYKDGYCLVDVIEHHAYEKSRFIKNPALFQRLLSASGEVVALPSMGDLMHAEAPAGASSADNKQWRWEPAEDDVEDPAASGSLDLMSSSPLEYQGQFISLNAEQEGVVVHPRLPVMVSGPAGSGKSSVALSMLSQYLREHRDEADAFPVLYVCESQELMREMRRLWQAMVGADAGELSSLVEFKTYDEMVVEQIGVDATSLWGKEEFLIWCKRETSLRGFPALNKMVWQECRIRSGYSSDAEYLSLGDRQSGFKREEGPKRAVVCHVYKTFLEYARVHGQNVAALEDLSGRITKPYKLIAADEAQDLSFAQLLFLYRLSRGSIAFFLGDNQLLHDNLSRLPFLKAMFRADGRNPENVITLELTYRCSEAVTVLANALTRIKYELTGGAADSFARMLKVADPTLGIGTASLFELKNTAEIRRCAELASSSRDVFVVTQAGLVDEAQRTFRTGQVFTPGQVKGLGARVVILWRLLDCEMAREAARVVSADESSDELHAGHRAKAGVGDSRYESFGNELIVAATRAIEHVVMFEKIKHDMKSIRGRIAKALETTQSRGAELAVAESTAVDWEEQAFDLYSRGYREQAQGIFVRSLKGRLEDFEGFIAAHHRKIDEGADVAVVESMAGGAVATATAVDVGLRRVTDLGASVVGEPVAASLEVTDSDAQMRRLIDALSQTDSKGKDALLAEKGNLILLRQMSEELFSSIPLTAWSAWLGKKKTSRPLLLDLVADADHGPFLLKRLLACGYIIPPKIWHFTAERDQGVFAGTSIPYWLLVHPEGQVIFTQLLRTYDISEIITTNFLITAPPRRPGLSPFAMLIASEPGLKLLRHFVRHHAMVLQKIPINVWSSPHPLITAEDGQHLTCLTSFQANASGLSTLKSLMQLFPILKNALMSLWTNAPIFDAATAKAISNFGGALKSIWFAAQIGDMATLKTIHGLGLDLNVSDQDGNTPAIVATLAGQVGVLRFLHGCHVDLNQATAHGITPLFAAAKYGHPAIIRELHRLQVNLHQEEPMGITVAEYAILYKQMDVLRALNECGFDLSKEPKLGLAPSLNAAKLGQVEALHVLRECGVDLNQETRRGRPAFAAVAEGQLEALKVLFNFCSGIDVQELMFIAAQTDHVHILEFLSTKSSNLNRPFTMSSTKLMKNFQGEPDLASKASALIERLVAEGQDKDRLLFSPLDLARLYGNQKVIAFLQAKEPQLSAVDETDDEGSFSLNPPKQRVAITLSQFGVWMGSQSKLSGCRDELRLPWVAANVGDIAELERLHGEGVDLNAPDSRGNTPAIVAAIAGQTRVLRLLHSYGVNLNEKSINGACPASVALVSRKFEVMEVLYELCPAIDTSALVLLAVQTDSVELLEFLSDQGADYTGLCLTTAMYLRGLCRDDAAVIKRMDNLIRELLAAGYDESGMEVLPIEIAMALGRHQGVIDFLKTKMPPVLASVPCHSCEEKVDGSAIAPLPEQSAKPQVATELSQLGIWGTVTAAGSTVSQSSSDDPHSLAASAGSFPDLKR